MHFEKISNMGPTYDPRELLKKRTRFPEAILNVSQVRAFLRKIATKKKGAFWKILHYTGKTQVAGHAKNNVAI